MSRGFSGNFDYNLDAKGRLSIPAEFRKILADNYEERVILTRDVSDKCLVAYPLEVWRNHEDKMQTLPMTDPAVKKYMRLVVSAAVECELDKQGRILVPPTLRDYAGLIKEAKVVGVVNKMEIWDKERWQDNELDVSELEKLSRFGL